MNKKMLYKITTLLLSISIALIIGFIIGWKATVLNGNISFDKANANIGYFECWGQVDEYLIDSIER